MSHILGGWITDRRAPRTQDSTPTSGDKAWVLDWSDCCIESPFTGACAAVPGRAHPLSAPGKRQGEALNAPKVHVPSEEPRALLWAGFASACHPEPGPAAWPGWAMIPYRFLVDPWLGCEQAPS